MIRLRGLGIRRTTVQSWLGYPVPADLRVVSSEELTTLISTAEQRGFSRTAKDLHPRRADTFAVLPTFEMVGWTFLDGMKTLPNGEVVGVDGDGTFSLLPGTRLVLGPAGDLGLFEVGVAGGLGFDDDGWYDGIFRTELRWSF